MEDFDENLKHINVAIEKIRRLARELSASMLEDLGLSAALQRLVNDVVKDCHIKPSVDLVDIDRFLPHNSQIIVYRILQEALSNIRKHSQATHFSVTIQRENPQRVSFTVSDNGKGYDLS
jgi:two-component system NarL family sensor kinase